MPCKVKHKLHMFKNYKPLEDGQQFRPKHIGALIKKSKTWCNKVGVRLYTEIWDCPETCTSFDFKTYSYFLDWLRCRLVF